MCEKATIKIVGSSVYIITESGAKALIPLDKVCDVVRRFNLCLDTDKIKCGKRGLNN